MKHKIHYSEESRRDMDEIWDYIALELQNRPAAQRVIDGILDAVDLLETFAERGAPLTSIADAKTDHRFLVIGHYLVLYRVSNGEVYVDRVLYGRRDYLRLLFGDAAPELESE